MTTLNQIADYIAGKLNDPFNVKLKDEIKFAVANARALLLRRDTERYHASAIFKQTFLVDLIEVDEIDSCKVDLGCIILRSKNPVPIPVRTKRPTPFSLVSAASIKGSSHILPFKTRAEVPFLKYNKFGVPASYDYINGYIYVWGNDRFKWIRLNDIFEDPTEINTCSTNETCYDDNKPYPISKDMVDIIIEKIITGEIRLNEDVEVKEEK